MSDKTIHLPEERIGLLAILLNVSEETIIDALSYKTNTVEAYRIRQVATLRNEITSTNKATADFRSRIDELKVEIIDKIRLLLIENNLTELELPAEPNAQGVVTVLYYDPDENFHESPVNNVSLDGDEIKLYVNGEHLGDVELDSDDLACNHLTWLCDILDCMVGTLKNPL